MATRPLDTSLLGILALAVSALVCSPSHAASCTLSVSNGETNLQDILNSISVGTAPNAQSGCLAEGSDATWHAVTPYSNATLYFEYAGYAPDNSFGIYDISNPANQLEIFKGADGYNTSKMLEMMKVGSQYQFTLIQNGLPVGDSRRFDSSNFGFYLHNPSTIFYSKTDLNGDHADHLAAFSLLNNKLGLQNAFLLSWEDLWAGGDEDFNDMGVVVSGMAPVPLPAAAWLLMSGLVGVAAVARRRNASKPT